MQAESLPSSRQGNGNSYGGVWRRPCSFAAVALSAALLLSGCMGSDRAEKPEIEGNPEAAAAKISPETIELVQTALDEGRLGDAEAAPKGVKPASPVGPVAERDVYYPGSEALGPDEMRVVACGTGMPNASLPG